MAKNEKDKKNISNLLKKLIDVGLEAAINTEVSIKDKLSDLPQGIDLFTQLIDQAKHSKSEMISHIKTELKTYLSGINVSGEIEKILNNYDVEVQAKLSFKKKVTKKNQKTDKST